MRSVFVILFSALIAFPAAAQTSGRASVAITDEQPGERIDKLFAELKRTRNEQAAARVSARIEQELARSGSASIDLLMQWAGQAMESGKDDVAMDLLDQVVILSPDYAEGWNRRATLHFTMRDYAKSMADIDRTLKLEPRHYGAISGLARIMSDTDRKEAAIDAWQRVLDIYPALRAAQDQLSTLSEEVAGQSI